MVTFEDVWDEILEEGDAREEIVVEADTRKKATGGKLASSTLTSCIAVGVYDGSNGYMVHIDPEHEDPDEYLNELSRFVFHLRNEADLEGAEVVAGGGHLPDLDATDFGDTGNLRQKENMYGKINMVEDFLYTHFDSLETEWGADPGHYSSLTLDVEEGVFDYDRRAEEAR